MNAKQQDPVAATNWTPIYRRAAKRLGIDLSKPITEQERLELEEEVNEVARDDDY